MAHCVPTGQEVSGVVQQPSHICIHTYTYMLTAHGMYVVRYPTLLKWTSHPQADQAIERGREEKGVGLRDWCLFITLPGQAAVSL